ncbi:SpoIID/LytB domain protein [Xylanimonas cellulosilytica DSM 15894]|uniref:SpoIID/LytB domain protein n=1 Tax=Xylanimonas cellulosilytica (strain DSM 15894 / JCM 12276 / CECT 5975 / KCTC 9989 / LMG 20990 / NBRC 107835 / XIL07) TaxID=446471 RepID=D1BX09_XYLCX|nr:SpoIID/LytB domain-containing protein [Xylanimonas cellulosilytica]ACZ31577.1 SpoIID/LytB domain protein [Xylanimonas cellulosilytica DSM 15894]
MRAPRTRTGLRGLLAAVVVAATAVAGLAAPAQAADPTFTFTGRGWGHGRGMGQYGALGYAVNHGWTTQQILNHFYRPAALATNAGNPEMTVELVALNGREVRIQAPAIFVNGGGTQNTTVRLVRNGANLNWFAGPGCNGPWTARGTVSGTAQITAGAGHQLKVCNPSTSDESGTRYRGRIDVRVVGSTQHTINVLPTQDYLRGVVPREMPASWANQGGGKGAQALAAQAVAARSYALSGSARASGAKTCDTTACQVYGGTATVSASGTVTSQEHALSNTAIDNTNGRVMRMPNGTIARTEFSSSTGGHTAGGTFTAVPDDGDSISLNPNRTWTASLSAADVASRLGVGTISSMQVTGRNGLGADGGRVTEVAVTSGTSTRTFTGNQVRSALGLKSDWFTITGSTPSPTPSSGRLEYRAHVQNVGWQSWVSQGSVAGTSGRSLRVEALQFRVPSGGVSGGVECSAHVQNVGWTGFVTAGNTCGTSGRSLRVEALRLRLTGELGKQFDVWYRVHVQDLGWLGWASNGAEAGTAGMSLRNEAVEVRLVPKGQAGPSSSLRAYIAVSASIQAHVATLGWRPAVGVGQTAGTSGRSLAMEALRVSASSPWSGGLECRAHVQNVGWTGWVGQGAVCGTTGRGLRQEAIALRLTGAASSNLDVWYRVHVQDVGWMGWTRNGAQAGTAGYSRRVEAVQVVLTPKGAPAPGSTARPFLSR